MLTPDDVSKMVFKLIPKDEMGDIIFDRQSLRVIADIDGKRSVEQIAKKTGLDLDSIRKIIFRLLEHKLIEPSDNNIPVLSEDFFQYLTIQLSLAIGPLAEILIEDAAASLGYELSRFPKHLASKLIDLLAEKIQREEKRVIFKRNLSEEILK